MVACVCCCVEEFRWYFVGVSTGVNGYREWVPLMTCEEIVLRLLDGHFEYHSSVCNVIGNFLRYFVLFQYI